MTGHGADRADAEAVVTTQQDRQIALPQLAINRLMNIAIPFVHLGEVPIARDGWRCRVRWAAEVSTVDDSLAVTGQRGAQSCDPQGLGSHRRAAVGGAHVRGGADQYCSWG